MLTCMDASHLISESQERKLGFRERMGLKFHLLMCMYCRRFEQQLAFVHRALRELGRRAEADTESTDLSSEARDRIRKAVAGRSGRK